MNVLSLFSGIGAFEKALYNNAICYNIVNYCEIDKYASKAYSLLHHIPEDKNLHDVKKIGKITEDIDLVTYGFPCQDISSAGFMRGFLDEQGEKTRSGLFYDALRIIEDTLPKFAIAENVKMLTSKRFINEFITVLGSLSRIGYNNYFKVLDAKDFGLAQHRERVFIISIRQDIDKGFIFPPGSMKQTTLESIIEKEVDEKYYLSDSRIRAIIEHKKRNAEMGNGFGARIININSIASTLTTSPDRSNSTYININGRVRVLTPRESFRAMGFSDYDFDTISDLFSDRQIYKMAGNSIAVNVLDSIFHELSNRYPETFEKYELLLYLGGN